jgi:peptide chain release factor 1
MIDKLEQVERRYERLTADLGNPEIIGDSATLQKVMRERSSIEKLVEAFREYRKVREDFEEAERLCASSDKEEREFGWELLPALKERREALEQQLQLLLLPRDPNDDKDVIVEIRAGAGGDEAALFGEEVLQMYLRFADKKGWKSELLDLSAGNQGGVKEASFTLCGDGVYSWMKYESGVHRVQRVPATEAQGRIHTSTITVAVMPEAEEVDIHVNPADVEMQVFRSTGSGGQSVNTTDSAVRLIHKPSGIVVKCQQEKSQLKNRAMAMKILRAKLFDLEQERVRAERENLRKGQVGTGDRSEKIRTYNFPQDRLTDHRICYTRHNLPAVMGGDIEDLVVACRTHYQAEALRAHTDGGRGPQL